MIKDSTYSYCWALRQRLGRVAPLPVYLNGDKKWLYFSDSSGKIQIKEPNGEWQDFIPGIEICGIRIHSAIRPIHDGYKACKFNVNYEYV